MDKKTESLGRILLGLLSVAGVATMAYLVYLHYAYGKESFCNIGEGLSCELVNQSLYSEIFGIPVSILGVLYFLAVFIFSVFRFNEKTLKQIAFVTIVFLGPSVYLTLIEIFVLENICVLCEGSKVLMLLIIGVVVYVLRPVSLGKNLIIGALIFAVIAGGTTYAIHANVVPEGKYDIFAQCLTDEGMLMYGSATCSFCAKQRAMFGSAFEFIDEIECDPRNPDSEVERCVAKDIEHTPTWIQEDAEGNELHRFEAGVVSFEELSAVSGCPIEE